MKSRIFHYGLQVFILAMLLYYAGLSQGTFLAFVAGMLFMTLVDPAMEKFVRWQIRRAAAKREM